MASIYHEHRRQAETITCPACGATPGEKCGRKRSRLHPHRERLRAARSTPGCFRSGQRVFTTGGPCVGTQGVVRTVRKDELLVLDDRGKLRLIERKHLVIP